MHNNTVGSLFRRLRQRFFRWRIDSEIFGRLLPHAQGEHDCGYTFKGMRQMARQTSELDSGELLALVEANIAQMPIAYRESFRYIMHRDLHRRITRYAILAQRRIPPRARVSDYWAKCV